MKVSVSVVVALLLLECSTAFLQLARSTAERLSKTLFSTDPDIYNIDVTELHPKVAEYAIRHCETFNVFVANNRFAEHTKSALEEAQEFVDKFYTDRGGLQPGELKYVIIDSGCGVGLSTYCLARLYPNIPVIGIDRSIVRLSKNKKVPIKNVDNNLLDRRDTRPYKFSPPTDNDVLLRVDGDKQVQVAPTPTMVTRESSTGPTPTNCILLRAELSDFYLLAAQQSDWVIHSHYMLYPNPYPKGKHLSRRWHGHPILPVVLALGGRLVLRSNWEIYCREMVIALEAIQASKCIPGLDLEVNFEQLDSSPSPTVVRPVTTHFEIKYSEAGQSLYQVTAELGERNNEQRTKLLAGIRSTSLGSSVSVLNEDE